MKTDHSKFLKGVSDYVEEFPEVAAYVQQAVAHGLAERLSATQERAVDMEVALALAMAKRQSASSKAIIDSKLAKWAGKTSLNWSKS